MKIILLLLFVGMFVPVFGQESITGNQNSSNDDYSLLLEKVNQLENKITNLEIENSQLQQVLFESKQQNQNVMDYLEGMGFVNSMQNQQDLTINSFEIIIGAIVGLVGMVVGATTVIYQKKQLRTTTLFKVFELLSDETGRQHRKFIYDAYKKKAQDPDFSQEVLFNNKSVPLENIVRETESRFDKVCALATTELLDKKILLELYGVMIVKSYTALKKDIEAKQKLNEKSLIHFSSIAKEFDPKIPLKDKTIY